MPCLFDVVLTHSNGIYGTLNNLKSEDCLSLAYFSITALFVNLDLCKTDYSGHNCAIYRRFWESDSKKEKNTCL